MMRDPASTRAAVWGLVVWVVAVLWGCATSAPSAPGLSGRLALQVYAGGPGSNVTQNVSAGFEWTGDALRGQLNLLSPLGSVLAQARWSEDGAWLKSSGGSSHRYVDTDAMAEQALGQRIPLAAVFEWLQARPWPQAPHRLVSATSFEQLGWRIDLTDHAMGRILAQRLDPPGVTLRVQLDKSPLP